MDNVVGQPGTAHLIEQPITGAPDLVHLRQEVMTFLSGVEEHVVTDAVLVTIMLAGDAFRYGRPPVTLRLRHVTERGCLRVEVDDYRQEPAEPMADGYRASILDRIVSSKGFDQSDGVTTSWAEISLLGPGRVLHLPRTRTDGRARSARIHDSARDLA